MTNKNKIMALAAAGIVAIGGILAGCNNKEANETAESKKTESISDNKKFVNLNEYLLEENKEIQQLLYSFNKDYATAVADKYNAFDTLIAKYGYNLTTDEAIAEYYEIINYTGQYTDKFTPEELAQIKELQIRLIRKKEGNN